MIEGELSTEASLIGWAIFIFLLFVVIGFYLLTIKLSVKMGRTTYLQLEEFLSESKKKEKAERKPEDYTH